jgi:hypothetical protein
MKTGFMHEAPLSFQLRPFRNFSISPQVSYRGVLYTQKIIKKWEPMYIDPDTRKIVPTVVNDTLRGFFYGQAINPSISAGYSPQIFGTFTFTNPNARLQAIRHVMKPSVSFSYVPSFKGFSSKMYRQVQIDTTGRMSSYYSIYDGNIFGTPGTPNSSRSGNISFNLTNILEAKVFQRNDTTGKPQTTNIIDNFGISTSYNIFADSLNWSPVSMVMRTTIFKQVNVSASSSFSLYGLDSKGRQIGTYYFSQTKKLMRLNNFAVSLDFSLSDLLKGNKEKKSGQESQLRARNAAEGSENQRETNPVVGPDEGKDLYDEFGYMKFDSPWTMNVSYSLNYSKPAFKSNIYQTISMNGSLKLTKNLELTYNTGYDFTSKAITMTQLHITRDLHCWNMSFDWIPNGYMKMWTFTIQVKASVLADLKYERRKDYHDNY